MLGKFYLLKKGALDQILRLAGRFSVDFLGSGVGLLECGVQSFGRDMGVNLSS